MGSSKKRAAKAGPSTPRAPAVEKQVESTPVDEQQVAEAEQKRARLQENLWAIEKQACQTSRPCTLGSAWRPFRVWMLHDLCTAMQHAQSTRCDLMRACRYTRSRPGIWSRPTPAGTPSKVALAPH